MIDRVPVHCFSITFVLRAVELKIIFRGPAAHAHACYFHVLTWFLLYTL